MKITFFFLMLLLSNGSYAQFAIIKDNDGYVNIRSEAQKGNNISDKLENGFIVYGFEPDNNWVGIDYSKNNNDKSGYVYKDRIKYLSEFTKIPLTKETPTKVIFQKDSLNIVIESKKFDSKTAKLTYSKDKSFLTKINGKEIWGTDGNIPRTSYKLITIIIGGKTIELPANAYADLFEPALSYTEINYNKKDDILYISSSNGDGAGGYELVWVIEKRKYKERKIARGF
ncbi:SH3 domain-containing protein [Flavobacterium branchiicola]|uniref:SH3 domain-containing protein n=1 Tax=Flavobacterium branchiicola TaxID=1114875 RepID=A0ABV9PG69_9FLAO|nr:hypothetical protein [Flavobacterium branchiicola]MBS7255596.1 hypothetical protein [Flavobacterium branchiicola]